MLKFSKQNAKTENLAKVPELAKYLSGKRKIYSLDLSSGYSCPGAKDCKSFAVVNNGKCTIKDSKFCQFRCFSASQEVLFPSLRKLRSHNFDAIKAENTVENIARLIIASLPKNAGIVRLHVGGDFFSLNYLLAMVKVAELCPTVLFYSYTKSIHFLAKIAKDCVDLTCGKIRENFIVTASYGGHYDYLIPELNIRTAKVIFDENTELPIDHDDSHAALAGGSFALLLHGTQPGGSEASVALQKLRKQGKGSYSRK